MRPSHACPSASTALTTTSGVSAEYGCGAFIASIVRGHVRFPALRPAARPATKRDTLLDLRPRSLTGLILLGFVIVALPALLGTISAAIEMRNLSAASERLVVNGVAATQYTQALVRQVSSLERTVRLYQIIPRPALLETFEQNRDLLKKTLKNFSALPGGNDERARVIANMEKTIDTIAEALSSKSPTRITSTLRDSRNFRATRANSRRWPARRPTAN